MVLLGLDISFWIIAGILFLISIIDVYTYKLKEGYIPAVLTTSAMLVALLFSGLEGVYGGVLALLIGMVFVDLELFDGFADLKVIVAGGIILKGTLAIAAFATLISIMAYGYKFVMKKYYPNSDTIAFVPVVFVAYILTLVMVTTI